MVDLDLFGEDFGLRKVACTGVVGVVTSGTSAEGGAGNGMVERDIVRVWRKVKVSSEVCF